MEKALETKAPLFAHLGSYDPSPKLRAFVEDVLGELGANPGALRSRFWPQPPDPSEYNPEDPPAYDYGPLRELPLIRIDQSQFGISDHLFLGETSRWGRSSAH